ncbi:Fatty acyl-CoA reductase 1 [Melipona quadrifasciata]|uniref:Fatty acyl-CoA reductase n=1 Tax=Melipona quadrifasciata TaxID=166423 RepID=A0A0N0U5R3_9HYME|nr:Fatty acyl-CoA reductase 1 [Melipona quadrifasciata]
MSLRRVLCLGATRVRESCYVVTSVEGIGGGKAGTLANNTVVFEFIKAKDGSPIFSKLHPVEGNVNLPDLGLSLKDRIMLIEKVNIVFHVAAAITFKQLLDDVVNTNMKGTSRIIDLYKKLKYVISFINVSTAYSKLLQKIINILQYKLGNFIFNVKMVPAKKDTRLDLVPVDYVIDTILCAVWYITIHRDSEVKVYNCMSNADLLRWGYLVDIFLECSVKTPMNDVLWYPYCKVVENKFVYFKYILACFVSCFFYGYCFKTSGRTINKKWHFRMMKINKYFNYLFTTLKHFTTHKWTFRKDNVYKMKEDINVLKDSNKLKLDLQNIDWRKYITNYHMGGVKFILKEKSDPVNAARRLSLISFTCPGATWVSERHWTR